MTAFQRCSGGPASTIFVTPRTCPFAMTCSLFLELQTQNLFGRCAGECAYSFGWSFGCGLTPAEYYLFTLSGVWNNDDEHAFSFRRRLTRDTFIRRSGKDFSIVLCRIVHHGAIQSFVAPAS